MMIECIVRCPYCMSEAKMVLEQTSPILYVCHGCTRCVVMHGSVIYTVSAKFVRNIFEKYKGRICGKLLAARVSPVAKDIVESQRLTNLHDLLNQTMDVNDFIKKLG